MGLDHYHQVMVIEWWGLYQIGRKIIDNYFRFLERKNNEPNVLYIEEGGGSILNAEWKREGNVSQKVIS